MDSEMQTQPEYAEHTAKNAPPGSHRKQEGLSDTVLAAQRQRNEAARRLLQEWLTDDPGYDEKVRPKVKQIIEENRLAPRKRFCD
jgi:hypothetical protein